MRLTRKVFMDLGIWMLLFGFAMGIVFPFFVIVVGVPPDKAFTPLFVVSCIAAGLIVGALNYRLTRAVVGTRLRKLVGGMRRIEDRLKELSVHGHPEKCDDEGCYVESDSEDELGEGARAFNALVAALSESLEMQYAMRTFSELLSRTLEIEKLSGDALAMTMEHSNAIAGAILVVRDGELYPVASHGMSNTSRLVDSERLRQALRKTAVETVFVPDDLPVDGVVMDFRPREVLLAPIVHRNIPLGVHLLAFSSRVDKSTKTRLQVFQQGLGLALNNALTHDNLQRLAAMDPLTGLYNRRFGTQRLREEFTRSVRSGMLLGVLMFDIDHFKKVNDTYGHLVGDKVLKAIAGISRHALREGDILSRYGGEEFMALLPAASAHDLKEIGERLRRSVEDMRVNDKGVVVRITVSVGGASFPSEGIEGEEDLVRFADEALYMAKESGRNQVKIRGA